MEYSPVNPEVAFHLSAQLHFEQLLQILPKIAAWVTWFDNESTAYALCIYIVFQFSMLPLTFHLCEIPNIAWFRLHSFGTALRIRKIETTKTIVNNNEFSLNGYFIRVFVIILQESSNLVASVKSSMSALQNSCTANESL